MFAMPPDQNHALFTGLLSNTWKLDLLTCRFRPAKKIIWCTASRQEPPFILTLYFTFHF